MLLSSFILFAFRACSYMDLTLNKMNFIIIILLLFIIIPLEISQSWHAYAFATRLLKCFPVCLGTKLHAEIDKTRSVEK